MSQTAGEVVRLVERFERNRTQYKSASYKVDPPIQRIDLPMNPRPATRSSHPRDDEVRIVDATP